MTDTFTRFLKLAAGPDGASLVSAWEGFLSENVSIPWDGKSMAHGHVPYSDIGSAIANYQACFAKKGVYVIGAWEGAQARVHYVGVVGVGSRGDSCFAARIKSRYAAFDGNGQLRTTGFREFTIAAAHPKLRDLREDFSPYTAVNASKYQEAGIPLPGSRGRLRRLSRAERFAKVELSNLWLRLIPAPPSTTKSELHLVEKSLIGAASAQLFRLHMAGGRHSVPLLNCTEVKANPFLSSKERDAYVAWLRGSWHGK